MGSKRISIAMDEETLKLLDEINPEKDASRSKVIRDAIKFYHKSKKIRESGAENLDIYFDLLSGGEHLVLDVDHWLLFLDLLESSDKEEEFWAKSKKVADSHADQLSSKIQNLEELLERLSACNFFRLNKISENEYTLIVESKKTRKFVKNLVKDFSESMGFETRIHEDIGKLRIKEKET